jgi:hypothetical protein
LEDQLSEYEDKRALEEIFKHEFKRKQDKEKEERDKKEMEY